tara:strand:+ start:293 stop:679 length:387 start_codon:yes stop_codon:yes gene_type:complete
LNTSGELYIFLSRIGAEGMLSLCVVWLGVFMTLPKRDRHWNGWVVWLLAISAGLGLVNSVLQLSRYGTDIASRFGSTDLTMILIWGALLIVWAVILGGISGVALGRRWYGGVGGLADSVSQRSVASSD